MSTAQSFSNVNIRFGGKLGFSRVFSVVQHKKQTCNMYVTVDMALRWINVP